MTITVCNLIVGFSLLFFVPSCSCYSTPIPQLLQVHSSTITQLKLDPRTAPNADDTFHHDMTYLRHILEFDVGDEEDDEGALKLLGAVQKTLSWRRGEGREICESAAKAIAEATEGGGWNNEPVLKAAPHSDKISQFISGKNIVTTTDRAGDLVYCIRAGAIDDVALMSAVTVEEMSEFFLYAKEVNTAVADMRSVSSGRFCRICTANDLSGVNLFGPASFRKALSLSSTKASTLYPAISAETFLLNLPKLLNALVKLFKPLFPKSVQAKLKFRQGPLNGVEDLGEVARPGAKREIFLGEIEALRA